MKPVMIQETQTQPLPSKIVKLKYDGDTMDAINFIEIIAKELILFGVVLEFLDGGEGYEEVKLTKLN